MRPELPQCLRSVAIDLGLQGSQYATLVALLREAANELEKASAKGSDSPAHASGVPPAADQCDVYRHQLRPCSTCEDD
jgi:succinylarginine dihydrolase